MKSCLKKFLFVTTGLLIIAAGFILEKPNEVAAGVNEGDKFDDWVVKCTKDEKGQKTCFLNQLVFLKDDKTADDKESDAAKAPQILASYQIGYFGQEKERSLKMIITLPANVLISAGTSVISSGKLIVAGKFVNCAQGNCNTIGSITDDELKTIITSKENMVAFMSPENKQVTMPLSNHGLETGIKALK